MPARVVSGATESRVAEISRILGNTGGADNIGDVQFAPVGRPEEFMFEETVKAESQLIHYGR